VELVAKTLHGGADRRSLRVLHRIVGVEPALRQLERNGRHLIVPCSGAAPEAAALCRRTSRVPPLSRVMNFWEVANDSAIGQTGLGLQGCILILLRAGRVRGLA
jgi:hypothetical protein